MIWHGVAHLHHVLLHFHRHFAVLNAVVHQRGLKLIVFNLLSAFDKNLVLRLVLLDHHFYHRIHLVLLGRKFVHLWDHVADFLHLLQLYFSGLVQVFQSFLFRQLGFSISIRLR